MQQITQCLLDKYLQDDPMIHLIDRHSQVSDEALTCQRWLRESPPKRLIFEMLYGDLLVTNAQRQKVLDVGGGVTCFTRELAKRHEYDLVDLLAHDDPGTCTQMEADTGRDFIHTVDWLSFEGDGYDLIIANDIFPNVDQRLGMFLDLFIPRCSTLRLLVTWYDSPRAYQVRRVDGDEIFFMLAWDLVQLMNVLQKHADRIVSYEVDCFRANQRSLYANGRQVGIVEFRGENNG